MFSDEIHFNIDVVDGRELGFCCIYHLSCKELIEL